MLHTPIFLFNLEYCIANYNSKNKIKLKELKDILLKLSLEPKMY